VSAQTESYEPEDPYQRLLNKTRARAIARYLQQEDSLLPNSIILATRDEVKVTLTEDRRALSLRWDNSENEKPLNIIDGQHRVEGLKILLNENVEEFSDFAVPVTILLDQPFYAQAILFATINGEQKKVPRSQIYDLLGYKPLSTPKLKEQAYLGEMAVQQFCHHAAKVLNSSNKSPWKGRIKMRGSGQGIVTQAAIVDHLAAYMVAKKEKAEMRYLPLLFPYFKDADLVGLCRLLVIYFVGISRAKPDFWRTDEAISSSLFGKTNGVAVMFSILHDLVCNVGGTEKLQVDFVKDKWSLVSNDILANPPPGGSKGFQAQVAKNILAAMFGADADKNIITASEPIKRELRKVGALLQPSVSRTQTDLEVASASGS
jgi:DGQHR domain-containing protein